MAKVHGRVKVSGVALANPPREVRAPSLDGWRAIASTDEVIRRGVFQILRAARPDRDAGGRRCGRSVETFGKP